MPLQTQNPKLPPAELITAILMPEWYNVATSSAKATEIESAVGRNAQKKGISLSEGAGKV
jgi:hypothetical protein